MFLYTKIILDEKIHLKKNKASKLQNSHSNSQKLTLQQIILCV